MSVDMKCVAYTTMLAALHAAPPVVTAAYVKPDRNRVNCSGYRAKKSNTSEAVPIPSVFFSAESTPFLAGFARLGDVWTRITNSCSTLSFCAARIDRAEDAIAMGLMVPMGLIVPMDLIVPMGLTVFKDVTVFLSLDALVLGRRVALDLRLCRVPGIAVLIVAQQNTFFSTT